MTSLADLTVLAVDIQATGSHPSKDRVLEVGWARVRASDREPLLPGTAEAHLIRWSGGAEFPRHIHRVTGIRREDLASPLALEPHEIWNHLSLAAREVAETRGEYSCNTVIHFSRFEEPHLRSLHQSCAPESRFPFDLLCTHEVARRLLPGLPRLGLRALAGYFGGSVPELRRSAEHVAATALIWSKLVDLLDREHGITTKQELVDWLAATRFPMRTGRTYPLDAGARLGLPHRPGVYRFLRSNGDVLYVGKAKCLHRRVNSYFHTRRRHGEHTLEMLTQAKRVDVTVTETALEAALLESDQIKRLGPLYNLALRRRNEEPGFCSRDLRLWSHEPDVEHPIGPLPLKEWILRLGALAEILEPESTPARIGVDWHTRLGLDPRHGPSEECFASGLEVFRQRFPCRPHGSMAGLLRLGALVWRERRRRAEDSDSGPAAESDQQTESTGTWSPERVADWLEDLVTQGAHLIRRSRWLCLLSESSLGWEIGDRAPGRKAILVFSSGNLVGREEISLDAEVPIPPGHGKARLERQRGMDRMTYDRLRVVTTEIRRLVSEGRTIELRLGPRPILRGHDLARILPWV